MEKFFLEQSLGFILHRTLATIKAFVRKEFQARDINLTIDQWVILGALWEKDGISQAELTDKTYKDRPTVTRMLDLMEKKALVYRQRSAHDRRVFKIFLTSEGRSFREKLIPVIIELNERIVSGLSQTETKHLFIELNDVFETTKSFLNDQSDY